MYALVGRPDTKLQLSFRAKIVRRAEFYFGYTQVMIWDLFKRSSPFRDINYDPEFFYRLDWKGGGEQWLDLGLFEHESNGRDGDASRSWDRSYLRFHDSITFSEHWKLFYSVKAWLPYVIGVENSDLTRYRGYGELEVTLSNHFGALFESDDLTLRLYPGGRLGINPLLGAQELTLRGKLKSQTFLPYAVFQVFHGYGENLLDYRENRLGLRAGLGF